MKDIALSLLSRGCGHVVQSHLGSQDGRLEVYFEPKVNFRSFYTSFSQKASYSTL